jgi:hypothetical protein
MTRFLRAARGLARVLTLTLTLAFALALASCSGADPCAGATTCVRVDVESETIARIDQLELDVVYGERHATTTTQAPGGRTTALPLSTAIVLDLTGDAAVAVGVVAAGKLGAGVLGTGAGSVSVAPGEHATIVLELSPIEACVAGAFYCGGDRLAGDPQTLYQCNAGGVPIARGVCTSGCLVRPTRDDVCRASPGVCQDGGTYCGGDKIDGDPQTLYVCMAGVGTSPVVCPAGCLVRPGDDDICR